MNRIEAQRVIRTVWRLYGGTGQLGFGSDSERMTLGWETEVEVYFPSSPTVLHGNSVLGSCGRSRSSARKARERAWSNLVVYVTDKLGGRCVDDENEGTSNIESLFAGKEND